MFEKSILAKCLLLLTPQQKKRLLLFAESPLHNPREDVRRLLGWLVKYPQPTQTQTDRLISDDFAGDIKNLRHVQSYSLRVVKDYLTWEATTTDDSASWNALRALLVPEGVEVFKHFYQAAKENIEKKPLQDADKHYTRYQMFELAYELDLLDRRNDAAALALSAEELTIFFLSERLRQGCSLFIHGHLIGKTQMPELWEATIALADTPVYRTVISVSVYYLAFRALSDTADVESITKLIGLIPQVGTQFSTTEARGIVMLAVNCCIRRINAGQKVYLEEIMKIYELGLAQDVFYEGGYLSRFTMNNIVVASLRLKRYEWASDFIEKYHDRVSPAYRSGTYSYNLALVAYQQGHHDKALDLLQQSKEADVLHQLDVRRIMMRIYYDQGAWSALESMLGSFKLFIYRQKNIGYHRTYYLNLIRFLTMRIKAKDRNEVLKIRTQVEACVDLAERQWLLEKVVC
jgi:tetratricopeptide (TPR) repeat protein